MSLVAFLLTLNQHWAILEKIQTGRWVEDMDFEGYQRNSMRNFEGLIKNEVEFPKGDQEKIMWNFQGQGSLFLGLEFPRDLTQF